MPPTVMTPWWRTTCCALGLVLAARVECELEPELFVAVLRLGEEEPPPAGWWLLTAAPEPAAGGPEETCVVPFTPLVAGCNGVAAGCRAVVRC